MKIKYECSLCGALYISEQLALACEQAHPAKETFEFLGVTYAAAETTYRASVREAQQVPKYIRLNTQLKNGSKLLLTYRIDHTWIQPTMQSEKNRIPQEKK